jgi:transposase
MLDDEISFETGGDGKPPVRRLEVLSGPGGRRRWTREGKSAIIEETLRPGANIADVARRHGLVPQQLYGWRSAARAREVVTGLGFVPVELESHRSSDLASSGNVVVVQMGNMAIHIPAGAGTDHIERVLLAARHAR